MLGGGVEGQQFGEPGGQPAGRVVVAALLVIGQADFLDQRRGDLLEGGELV